MPSTAKAQSRQSGFMSLRTAFGTRRKNSKFVVFEYLAPAGSGEPEVDTSGLDCRDVLEDPNIGAFRPVVRRVWPLEKGTEAFRDRKEVSVIRLVN